MKKLIITFLMLFLGGFAMATPQTDALKFFDSYVKAANNYSTSLPNFYTPNAKIIRVVIKNDGTTVAKSTDMTRYKSELIRNSNLAKMRNYKNYYSNIKVTKQGNDYKISCMRQPSLSNYKIPAHFVVGKDKSGQWKIKEESMHTKMQIFLWAK